MSVINKNAGYGRAMFDAIHAAVGGTFGNVFVVVDPDDTDEGNYQHLQEIFSTDFEGRVRFYTSLSSANSATESNNNDVVILDGNSTHELTEMLTVSNNRVHFIGLDYLLGIHRRYGQSTKVSLGVTTETTDIATLEVTGVRCSFRGIKFLNSNTVDEGIYAVVDAGEYTYFEDCEFYKSTDLDQTGAAELVANGDSSHYKNCWIGSTANEISGAVIRPCVLVTGGIVTGKKARDVTFEDCIFARKTGNAANRFIYGANATDVERMMLLKDCLLYNNPLGTADADYGIAFGASQTEGSVILKDCSSVGVTNLSATTGVYLANGAANANNGGEAIQAA